MKKVISLVMVLLLCLGLCACAGGDGNTTNQVQSDNGNDRSKYLGTYICDGFYDKDNTFIKDNDGNSYNNAVIILENNNVAKVSLNPETGAGFTFYYTVNYSEISLTSDFNRDGVPDTGKDAVTAWGVRRPDGSLEIFWDDGLAQHYEKEG